MNRREFLGAASTAVAAFGQKASKARPNIIMMMADDMGFSDLGCYGSEIRTPNIDALAKRGVRFTQFYNTARCCPTRASLLTGLYPHQTGVGHMVDNPKPMPGYTGDLNRECVTIAEVLKAAGYQTMMSGKWHVTPLSSESKHNWPLQRGFDKYYGIIHGASNFFTPFTLVRDNEPIEKDNADYYLTDALSENAARYIDEAARRSEPFFLYLAYTSPHWPLHAPEEDIERYKGKYREGWDALRSARHRRMIETGIVDRRWEKTPRDELVPAWEDAKDKEWQERRMEVYAAQIDRMDQGVGRVLEALQRSGREDNTLVLFLADNGGCAEELGTQANAPHYPKQTGDGRPVQIGNVPGLMPGPETTFQSYGVGWANASNTPFRRYKHWVHEGGISSPLIARWPNEIKKQGAISREPGHLIDLMATCADVAGASYPRSWKGQAITPLEGRSLRPAFDLKPVGRKTPLFWEHEGNRALRQDQWKLVSRFPGDWELYDLEADRTELHNLAAKHPDRVARMAAEYDAWAKRAHVEPWDKVRGGPPKSGSDPGQDGLRQRRSRSPVRAAGGPAPDRVPLRPEAESAALPACGKSRTQSGA